MARFDDAVNWIPARLSAPIISIAEAMIFGTGRRSFATAFVEGKNHKSHNAGRPEATFASALGVRIVNPGLYFGRLTEKPWIGVNFPLPRPEHIPEASLLMAVSSIIAALVMIVFLVSIVAV